MTTQTEAVQDGGAHADELTAVRGAVAGILADLPAPPSSLRVRSGPVTIELSWAGPAAAEHPRPGPPPQPAADQPAPDQPARDAAETLIVSPIVGVFYRAPEPGAPPFVEEGTAVTPGQQVAIVEAMKMMIPVEAACAGRISRVLGPDGAAVEYGAPLFAVAPADQP